VLLSPHCGLDTGKIALTEAPQLLLGSLPLSLSLSLSRSSLLWVATERPHITARAVGLDHDSALSHKSTHARQTRFRLRTLRCSRLRSLRHRATSAQLRSHGLHSRAVAVSPAQAGSTVDRYHVRIVPTPIVAITVLVTP
jgi:hypothetical protein